MNTETLKADLATFERQAGEAQQSIAALQRALAQKQAELVAASALATYVRATLAKVADTEEPQSDVPLKVASAGEG